MFIASYNMTIVKTYGLVVWPMLLMQVLGTLKAGKAANEATALAVSILEVRNTTACNLTLSFLYVSSTPNLSTCYGFNAHCVNNSGTSGKEHSEKKTHCKLPFSKACPIICRYSFPPNRLRTTSLQGTKIDHLNVSIVQSEVSLYLII